VTAPGNTSIIVILVLGIVVTSAYAIGRIQQWYLFGVRRDAAYRAGYDSASSLMLSVVASAAVPGESVTAKKPVPNNPVPNHHVVQNAHVAPIAHVTQNTHAEHRLTARNARPAAGGARQRQRAVAAARGNPGSRHARLP
jgi:hypothetical protein